MTAPATYATLDQAQDMELGVTGDVVTIDGYVFERLIQRDGDLFCWISHSLDVNGELCDWDRVPEDEAIALGLVRS